MPQNLSTDGDVSRRGGDAPWMAQNGPSSRPAGLGHTFSLDTPDLQPSQKVGVRWPWPMVTRRVRSWNQTRSGNSAQPNPTWQLHVSSCTWHERSAERLRPSPAQPAPLLSPPRKGNADGGGSSAVGSPFTTSSSHEEEKKWVGAAAFLPWEKWKWGHSNPCSLPCCSASKPSVIEPGGSGKGTDGAAGVSTGSARSSLLHPPCLASSLSWPWAEQNSSWVTGKHSTLGGG